MTKKEFFKKYCQPDTIVFCKSHEEIETLLKLCDKFKIKWKLGERATGLLKQVEFMGILHFDLNSGNYLSEKYYYDKELEYILPNSIGSNPQKHIINMELIEPKKPNPLVLDTEKEFLKNFKFDGMRLECRDGLKYLDLYIDKPGIFSNLVTSIPLRDSPHKFDGLVKGKLYTPEMLEL